MAFKLKRLFSYLCTVLNIRDILDRYKADERVKALATAINSAKSPRIQLRGLVGSGDATLAVALYFLQHKHMIFVLPEREEAGRNAVVLEASRGRELVEAAVEEIAREGFHLALREVGRVEDVAVDRQPLVDRLRIDGELGGHGAGVPGQK